MKTPKAVNDLVYPAATLIGVLVLWYGIIVIFDVAAYLLPAPHNVIKRIIEDFGFLIGHSSVTIYETLGGFILSALGGVILAMAIVASPVVDKSLMPWLVLSQTFPKVALAPLIVVWFGLGFVPKLIVVFLVAFFPVVISTVVGLRSLEQEMLELARSMRATRMQLFWYFRFPTALPNILAGLKVSVAFAVVGAVIAEWVAANAGLGYLLLRANANLDTTLLFSVLVMLMIIGVALYYAVEVMERVLIPWHATQRLKHNEATM